MVVFQPKIHMSKCPTAKYPQQSRASGIPPFQERDSREFHIQWAASGRTGPVSPTSQSRWASRHPYPAIRCFQAWCLCGWRDGNANTGAPKKPGICTLRRSFRQSAFLSLEADTLRHTRRTPKSSRRLYRRKNTHRGEKRGDGPNLSGSRSPFVGSSQASNWPNLFCSSPWLHTQAPAPGAWHSTLCLAFPFPRPCQTRSQRAVAVCILWAETEAFEAAVLQRAIFADGVFRWSVLSWPGALQVGVWAALGKWMGEYRWRRCVERLLLARVR